MPSPRRDSALKLNLMNSVKFQSKLGTLMTGTIKKKLIADKTALDLSMEFFFHYITEVCSVMVVLVLGVILRKKDKHPFNEVSEYTYGIWWHMNIAELALEIIYPAVLLPLARRYLALKHFYPFKYGKAEFMKHIFSFAITLIMLMQLVLMTMTQRP